MFVCDVASGRPSVAVVCGHKHVIRWLVKEDFLYLEAQTDPNVGRFLGHVYNTNGGNCLSRTEIIRLTSNSGTFK